MNPLRSIVLVGTVALCVIGTAGVQGEEGTGEQVGKKVGMCSPLTESERRATEIAEKQGQKECHQGPDGRSEGGEPPPK